MWSVREAPGHHIDLNQQYGVRIAVAAGMIRGDDAEIVLPIGCDGLM